MNGVIERAESTIRHRALAAIALGTALAATQGWRMDGGGGPAAWGISGAIVALFLLWASGLLRGRAFRGIVNDEGSDINRRRAMMIGFWNMMAAALVCYALTFLKDYGPRDAIEIIATVGMTSALVSFGVAEMAVPRRCGC